MRHAMASTTPMAATSAAGPIGQPFFTDDVPPIDPRIEAATKPDVSGLAHWAEDPEEKRRHHHAGHHRATGAAHGLSSFGVAPPGQTPGAHQISQAQHDNLASYGFGTMHVVGDKDRGHLANNQMTQSQYEGLQSAWLNITAGTGGMHVAGTGATAHADEATFYTMLRSSLDDSPRMRRLVSDIGNDRNPSHRFEANVGRSQPGVLGDSFRTSQIDLDDLINFREHPVGNEVGQTEMLAHILAERRSAVQSTITTLPDVTVPSTRVFDPSSFTQAQFGAHHAAAIAVQNQIRDERHAPSHIDDQVGIPHPSLIPGLAPLGGSDLQIRLSNRANQVVHTNTSNDITRIDLPPNKSRRDP